MSLLPKQGRSQKYAMNGTGSQNGIPFHIRLTCFLAEPVLFVLGSRIEDLGFRKEDAWPDGCHYGDQMSRRLECVPLLSSSAKPCCMHWYR